MRTSRPLRHRLLVPLLLVALVVPLVIRVAGEGPRPAAAAVVHGNGFAGVVDGFRSWYGSYLLGERGEVWCVDHGIPAPDAVLGYEPTALQDRAPETRRAVAWAVGRYGVGADRVTSAALMLVLHDLMGARYPSGPLSVDALVPAQLQGFEGQADLVIERARHIKADAVGRAHLQGPMALAVEADTVPAGGEGQLRARVTDAAGSPVAGVVIHPAVEGAELLGDVDRETDADGRATWRYRAAPGANRFHLSAGVAGADLLALRPARGPAQRVVAPTTPRVDAATEFEGVVLRRFSVLKRGDGEPRLPVAGARFTVAGHELVVGEDGRTPTIELAPGTYVVTEAEAPPGYAAAGPWTVVVHDTDVVLEVANEAVRGALDILKVDAMTGAAVEGARFAVRADVDADPSSFEHEVTSWGEGLLPGRYEVREVEAPPHYRHDPSPRIVEVRGGERATLRFENVPLATVSFEKRPALPGAVFAVRAGPGGLEVGRCTTDASGRCALEPDVVDGGSTFCWEEVVAPPGWGLAEGACLSAGGAGTTTIVRVDELPLPAPPAPPPPSTEVEPAAGEPPVVLDAPPSSRPPPAPTRTVPVTTVPSPVPAVELPRTGGAVGRLAGGGLVLSGVGVLLVASATGGASSSGTPGRRGIRRRRSSTAGGRCRP